MEEINKSFLDALLLGQRSKCEEIISELRSSNIGTIELYEKTLKESLYKIGELWEYNKVGVAVEHMATSIVGDIMNQILPEIISKERKNKKIVISCVENEVHQVGSKMVADIFEKNGWDTFFLGTNIPIKELIEYCKMEKPDLIALSLTLYANMNILKKAIIELRKITATPILIGGFALINTGEKLSKKFENVLYFKQLEEIDNYIKGVHDRR